ncbi:component of IIS longevity pathway SMK-1-domain-containing protein [Plectosphaerella plurivora]|uniref:Component of IIS longevity pathway SMK-1-domain-containing protein n=1 Tax=Plectosphaerella plurivora TaxID=936078 RepID=A0A9P8VDR8_9PEZI|nr:component of IIS longevity pathway SMK-1-domain-containing protein [Plectosphaerella plurivora]
MAQAVPHQPTDKKRVKVYELRSNDWFDRGTGFCTAAFLQQTEDGQPRDPRVWVESEDQPNRLLLETKVCKEDTFQKQQETLIVWTDVGSGVDMALSFQEAEGCHLIWKFISSIQTIFQGPVPPPADDSLSDDMAMDAPNAINLPAAELRNLPDIETAMRIMSQTANGRDALAKFIMNEDYIGRLIPLVQMAEDLESLTDLHRLCNIIKIIILLNDTSIIEHAVSDECVLGVVGALEYDPDFPSHKANHRHWLDNQGRYKEVVPIEDDAIRRKIHQTYRLQYLKDVVLARILDDPTFSVLNSLIFFNQVDIVQHLQGNASFLNELFGIFRAVQPDQRKKKDAVLFIQQCCAIAKNLQPPARQTLYNNFIAHGLLQVINFGLRHGDVAVRVGATDVLVSLIDHDPHMIRQTLYRQIQDGHPLLTDSLVDLLLVEADLGVRSQISDALRVLLDQGPGAQAQEAFKAANGEFPGRGRLAGNEPQHELLLGNFYDISAKKLFKPIIALEGRKDMAFTVQQAGMFTYLHLHRSKFFVLQNNIAQRVKYLRLVAIRFFRNLIGSQDDFYIKHLTEKQVLGPILKVLVQTLPRDNLLSSACLELFEFIKKENVKDLVRYLVQNHRETLVSLSYLDTFRELIARYDQPQQPAGILDYFPDESENSKRPSIPVGRNMEHNLAMDMADEEYWNTSDDEDGPESKALDRPTTNGDSAPQSKPLVDYPSDEEADENQENPDVTHEPATGEPQTPGDGSAKSPTAVVAPPERLSEKRRREEEDEDELGKLVHNKRRNSSGSISSNSSVGSVNVLRRKKNFADRSSPSAAPRKISINISPSVKTGGNTRADEES